jgi:hypothetical protein
MFTADEAGVVGEFVSWGLFVAVLTEVACEVHLYARVQRDAL